MDLLEKCAQEAERADTVWTHLSGLRATVPDISHPHLTGTIDEIRACSDLLRQVANLSQIHQDRMHLVLDYLNMLLPSLSKSLRDMTSYYEDRSLSRQNRWRTLYHELSEEGGMLLPHRFYWYRTFLRSLKALITRSPNFDFNLLESARIKVMQLREARGIRGC